MRKRINHDHSSQAHTHTRIQLNTIEEFLSLLHFFSFFLFNFGYFPSPCLIIIIGNENVFESEVNMEEHSGENGCKKKEEKKMVATK